MSALAEYVLWVAWFQTQHKKPYGFIVLVKLICGALQKLLHLIVILIAAEHFQVLRIKALGVLTSFLMKDFLHFLIRQEFSLSI